MSGIIKTISRTTEHDYCPRCGHNYFNGGSGLCEWCIDELNPLPEIKPENKIYNKCIPAYRQNISKDERIWYAEKYGENWANVISDLGDQ